MDLSVQKMPQIENIKTKKNSKKGKRKNTKTNKENLGESNLNIRKQKVNSKKKKEIQKTPKITKPNEESIEPSPMSMVLKRHQQVLVPKKNIVSLAGTFSRPREQIENTLHNLKYEIMSPVTKNTNFVLYASDDKNEKVKLAAKMGIPIISEKLLFDKPDNESDTESESESLEVNISDNDESEALIIDDEDEDDILKSDQNQKEQRLKNTKIAFVGKFETPIVDLREDVLSNGGQITAVEALALPPTHIVLSHEYGNPQGFIDEYSSYWWIRSAVFLDEAEFLDICDGKKECPHPKKNSFKSVQKSMKRLSLEISNESEELSASVCITNFILYV